MRTRIAFARALSAALACTLGLSGIAKASQADLANAPLTSITDSVVKPNILFILDDSGSMNWKYMPDDLSSSEEYIGFRNNPCNLVYYNPSTRYVVPRTATGGDINSAAQTSFTAAYNDGYASYYGFETRTSSDSGATWSAWSVAATCTPDTSGTNRRDCRPVAGASAGTTTNLSTSFRAFVNDDIEDNSVTTQVDTAQPAYYWKYLGTQVLQPGVGDCRKLVSPNYTVTGASYASGVVTFTTSTAHNFLLGQTVGVDGIRPTGYRKHDYVVTEVPDSTHFKAALASNPGGFTDNGTAWNATEYQTINEYCTDNTRTTSTCAALGKTTLWRKVIVSSTSGPATVDLNSDGSINASDADERQNFANWFSYYQNRMKTMKAAAGRAFSSLTDSKRVGFITINPNSPVDMLKYKRVLPFDTTQKNDWYGLLYSQTTNGSTPLREALARAGRYFAHKTDAFNSGMDDDPVEYSCQQNFAILTTDGYWNGNQGRKLDGTTSMDNQDGIIGELDAYRPAGSKYEVAPRPIYDGASTTYTWNEATRYYQNVACNRQEKRIQQIQKNPFGTWEEETRQLQKKEGQLQFQSEVEANTSGQLYWRTSMEKKQGQLQWRTYRKKATGQLQFSTNLKKRTGQLQIQSKVQRKVGQVEFTTKYQQQRGQLQYSTTLQQMTGQLQARTWGVISVFPLVFGWSGWFDTSTCTEAIGVTECQIIPATWTYVTSCAPTRAGAPGTYSWWGDNAAVDCRTTAASPWTNTATCAQTAEVDCRINATPSYITAYPPNTCVDTRSGAPGSYSYWGDANATVCSTAASFNPAWTSVSSCDEESNTDCRVNGTDVSAQSCDTSKKTLISGSYYRYTGGASGEECTTLGAVGSAPWTNAGACSEVAGSVNCQMTGGTSAYLTYSSPSCTLNPTGSAGSYVWTGAGVNGNATVECLASTFSAPTSVLAGTCTRNANTNCTISNAPAYLSSYSNTCSDDLSGSTFTAAGANGSATSECSIAATPSSWNTRTSGTCVDDSNTDCRIATGVSPAAADAAFSFITTYAPSCTTNVSGSTYTAAGANGSATVECRDIANNWNPTWTLTAGSAACQESASVQCQLIGGSWATVQSCTPNHNRGTPYKLWTARSGSNTETDCRTVAMSAWANATTCTQATTLDGRVDCRINDIDSTNGNTTVDNGVPPGSCLSQTRSGSAGSYSYTGGANANECDTVVTTPFHTVPYACTTAAIDGSGYSKHCQFVGGAGFADATSCIPDANTNCQYVDLTGWVASDVCVAVATPDASGQTTLCQNAGGSGHKQQVYAQVTASTYSGPGQTGTLLSGPTVTATTTATDIVTGACYASAPALPASETVIGAGPPTPPDNCTGGSQVWPCETYASGGGGLSASIVGLTWNAPGVDPTLEPATATLTTGAAHTFLVGHSVTITDISPSGYRGNYQIIEVADNTHFKVLMPTNFGAYTAPGTASLFFGSSGSLADVAQYYYKTDLRNSSLSNCTGALGGATSVCDDNVPSTGTGVEDDRANWQHMTTFTMGLGLTGTVVYSPNYKTEQCIARPISGITWSGGYARVTTAEPHGFYQKEGVVVAGGGNGGYRGQFRIYDILSATEFRYQLSTNPGATSFGSGTVTGCPDFTRIRTGTINWPVPIAGNPTALDDLWHAAVNGRGQYFSAGDPDSVVSGLSNALSGIEARVGAAAAAATSNLEPVAGDNFAYTAKYKTKAWTGDLEAREIDLTTGAVSGTVIWSAQSKLDTKTKTACDNRNIKLFRAGATNNLVDFTWDSYACNEAGLPTGSASNGLNAGERANFDATVVTQLSHYGNLGDGTAGSVDQRTPAAGANLVNYLRGQRGKEGFSSGPPVTNTDINKLYRSREHVLGDIVNAQPVFVRGPFAEYDDTGYAAFKNGAAATRTPMVYAAANDGMLHAVYAGSSVVDTAGGQEAWAFIPSLVLPNLHRLASENYDSGHVYSVDGTPTVGDVDDPIINPDPLPPTPRWKTILVSGLRKGGKGYYALDITDPATPKALWEFKHDAGNCVSVDATTRAPAAAHYSDCHLGYSFNNPVISKLYDGRWVVFVTSGYNNVNSPPATGDGVGYLYVLEAMTGKILYKIATGAGDSTTPSGLNHIASWVEGDALRDNKTERVYGVDLLGNVWRFDVNDILNTAGREATLIAQVVDSSGVPQPITTRPEMALVDGNPFVYVGTGRYLGTTDAANLQGQSVWALRDDLSETTMTNLRTSLRKMVVTNQGSGTSAFRTNECVTSCGSGLGWFVDLPDSGERVNIDMKLQLGTLVVASNVPETNACNVGGYAWLNYFNNKNGLAIANSADHAVGRRLVGTSGQESLAVGLNIVRLPSGKTVVIATTSAAQQVTVEAPFDVPPPTGKRVSWREIVQ